MSNLSEEKIAELEQSVLYLMDKLASEASKRRHVVYLLQKTLDELVAIDNAKSHGDKELELYNEKAAADKSWALHQQFCNTSTLTFSASDLAARTREAKAGKRDMQEVIDDHDDYLTIVKNGGLLVPPSAADVDFVEKNITHLKDVYHGN